MDIAEYLGCKLRVHSYDKGTKPISLTSRLKGSGILSFSLESLSESTGLKVYHSDHFVSLPGNIKPEAGTFVVGVGRGKSFYFDFSDNDMLNTSIVPSIKGVNPISGRATEGAVQESYVKCCPEHGTEFKADRECSECGYQWPHQNFLTDSSDRLLGFRSSEGKSRQFFLTEDESRDVAGYMTGDVKEYFEFFFFKSKDKKVKVGIPSFGNNDMIALLGKRDTNPYTTTTPHITYGTEPGLLYGGKCTFTDQDIKVTCSVGTEDEMYMNGSRLDPGEPHLYSSQVSSVSVGAGDELDQEVEKDSIGLPGWKDECEASIKVYFVYEDELEPYVKKGFRTGDLKKEGILSGIPVG